MKSKISLAFNKCKKEKRTALITYTVAGENTKTKFRETIACFSLQKKLADSH